MLVDSFIYSHLYKSWKEFGQLITNIHSNIPCHVASSLVNYMCGWHWPACLNLMYQLRLELTLTVLEQTISFSSLGHSNKVLYSLIYCIFPNFWRFYNNCILSLIVIVLIHDDQFILILVMVHWFLISPILPPLIWMDPFSGFK